MRNRVWIGLVALCGLAFAGQEERNPAEVAVPQGGWALRRHAEKLDIEKSHKFDLLMIGDSITHNFEKNEYQATWNQYFAPKNALDLGYSGARTENILWNIRHGELDGQKPKAITLMIGTNNADERNYPTHHTPEQIYGGIKTIVEEIRDRLPQTKILLLGCFPYGAQPARNSRGIVLRKTNELAKRLADDEHVFWLDVTKVFLNRDGSMNKGLMPDMLHPSPEGAHRWADAMDGLLSKLMGED